MTRARWRLLLTESQDGPMNMAIDHAILESVAEQRVLPTLRFYAWQPPCLSLGYTQPIQDIDRTRLDVQGWGLVRRLTGGRAVLHIDELTYSVTLPDHDPIVASDIVTSYRHLSQALVKGLQQLGVVPHADKRADRHASDNGPVCFEVPSHYEITVNEKKLVGSAQVRKFGAVLQHGSLPLHGDIARICDALSMQDDARRETIKERVRQRAATLEQALSFRPSWQQVADALTHSFRTTFDLDLNPEELTIGELVRAKALREEQYANESWLARF